MNALLLLLGVGAAAYIMRDQIAGVLNSGGATGAPGQGAPTPGLTTAGQATLVATGTDNLPSGARVETVENTAVIVPPGGTTPVAQPITEVRVNYDPGNPQPGSVIISPVDLSRKMGYYTPDPLTATERQILRDQIAAMAGNDQEVLRSLAAGRMFDYTGQFSRGIADWNHWRGEPAVTEAFAGSRWNDRVNQEEYLTMANAARGGGTSSYVETAVGNKYY